MSPPGFRGTVIEPREPAAYEDGYGRFIAASDAIESALAGWVS